MYKTKIILLFFFFFFFFYSNYIRSILHNCFVTNVNTFHEPIISFLGRAALQKRIMVLLRKIEHCVNGIQSVCIYIHYIYIYICIYIIYIMDIYVYVYIYIYNIILT